MADVFNQNPIEFINLNDLFPVLNSAVGLTYEQFRILVENTFWLKNRETVGVVKAYIVSGSSEFGSLWLSLTDGGAPLVPDSEYIYIVQTNGQFKNKVFSWNGEIYEQLAKDSDNNYTDTDKSKVDSIIINGDGTKYLADDGEYKTVSGGGIPDAPTDGKEYVRKDSEWENTDKFLKVVQQDFETLEQTQARLNISAQRQIMKIPITYSSTALSWSGSPQVIVRIKDQYLTSNTHIDLYPANEPTAEWFISNLESTILVVIYEPIEKYFYFIAKSAPPELFSIYYIKTETEQGGV